jgi:hypothetical protein
VRVRNQIITPSPSEPLGARQVRKSELYVARGSSPHSNRSVDCSSREEKSVGWSGSASNSAMATSERRMEESSGVSALEAGEGGTGATIEVDGDTAVIEGGTAFATGSEWGATDALS